MWVLEIMGSIQGVWVEDRVGSGLFSLGYENAFGFRFRSARALGCRGSGTSASGLGPEKE